MSTKVEYELSLRDQLSGKINSADAAVNKFERSLAGAKSSAMSLGSALGIAFGVAGVAMFTRSMITAGTTVENARTGLTTLLKDSAEAGKVIENTMADATSTPFAFEGLLQANKALISAGVNSTKAREDVLNLANAIAATGGGDAELQRMVVNLQQISNTGKATALDIKQFAYAGVNIYKVLEAAGQKITKGNENQVITYEQITSALRKAHEAGGLYYNGLENMAGNTSVKISNLGDAMFQLKVKMFNDLKPAIEAVISAAFRFIDKLKELWNWAVRNKEAIKNVATALGVALVAFKSMTIVSGIMSAIQVAMASATAAGVGFGAAMVAALGPIAAVSIAVMALVGIYKELTTGIHTAAQAAAAFNQDSYDSEKRLLTRNKEQLKRRGHTDKEATMIAAQQERDKLTRWIDETEKELVSLKEAAKRDIRPKGVDDLIMTKSMELSIRKSQLKAAKEFDDPNNLMPSTPAGKAATLGGTPAVKTDSKSKAVGSKAITINVSIGDLIKEFNINTTNLKESSGKIKDAVVSALTGAVNDFQIVAGE